MSAFPNIASPNKIEESKVKVKRRTPFEKGYVQVGAKHTRSRRTFSLTWRQMKASDLFGTDALLDHFEANQGGAFSWTHPDPNVAETITVIYSDDKIPYDRDGRNTRWHVTVNLEEL